jgi:hypothetical protein
MKQPRIFKPSRPAKISGVVHVRYTLDALFPMAREVAQEKLARGPRNRPTSDETDGKP